MVSSTGSAAKRSCAVHSIQSTASISQKGRGVHLFIDRIAHRTAVLFLFPLILALSAGLTAVSTTRSRSSNWYLLLHLQLGGLPPALLSLPHHLAHPPKAGLGAPKRLVYAEHRLEHAFGYRICQRVPLLLED
jgi:hypothetical protein